MTISKRVRSTAPKRTSKLISQIKKGAKEFTPETKQEIIWTPDRLIPSGCTLLNLACSDSIHGAWPLGRISSLPGASQSGKTVVLLSTFMECAKLARFNKHKLIHDDIEQRNDFNVRYLFGPKTAKRLQQPPLGISNTVQDLSYNLTTLLKAKQPFIYALDSWDALSSDEELEKEMRRTLAAAKTEEAAKKIAGSYGAEKAKMASTILRMIKKQLADTESAVIIVQQLRQKMNPAPFTSPWTTAGGEAPYYYSHVRPMLFKAGAIKEKDFKVGTKTKAKMDKNSLTGRLVDIEFSIYVDLGIDDVGTMVDFLTKHWWDKKGQTIQATELGLEGTRKKLIRQIEREGKIPQLRKVTQECWNDIREGLLMKDRKKRYEEE